MKSVLLRTSSSPPATTTNILRPAPPTANSPPASLSANIYRTDRGDHQAGQYEWTNGRIHVSNDSASAAANHPPPTTSAPPPAAELKWSSLLTRSSTHMSRRLITLAFLSALAVMSAPPLKAEDKFRIRVDLKEKKVLPEDPTINLQYKTSGITIDFINDPRVKPPANADEFQVGAPDLPTYVRVRGQPGKITWGDNLVSLGSSHVVTFRRCEQDSFAEEGIHQYDARFETDADLKGWAKNTDPTDDDPRYPNHPVTVDEKMCPFAVLNERWTNSWIVFADESTVSFSIRAYTKQSGDSFWNSVKQGNQVYAYSVPIYLRNGVFSLRWSAGVAFFERRNERYALRKIEGNSDNVTLDPLDDTSPPYQLSAMAHYAITRAPALSLAAGVGVDVPVKEPSFMAGVSVSAPTISWLDDAYLTIGYAYSPADRLKEKFVGLETLPATTRESDLLERESDFEWFISLTYGFAGGEQKFKGVFSSSKR